MDFLTPVWYTVLLVLHIIGVVIAVGAVTITDYFHLIGLKRKSLERRLLVVYPILGKIIIGAATVIVLTGAVLLINEPSLLQNSLFQLKLALFGAILINGAFLHIHVFKHVIRCVLKKKGTCPRHVLWASSISGAISFTTWYAILILSLTKEFEYTVFSFLTYYFIALILVFMITYFAEEKARAWRK